MSNIADLYPVDADRALSAPPHGVPCEATHRLRLASHWGAEALRPSKFPSIGLAQSPKDLERLGRLRYELFVERDGKGYAAVHASGSFLEKIDDLSLNLQATDHQRCLAAVRLTKGQDALTDRQLSAILLNCELARPPYSDCLVLSRLIVRPESRARFNIPDLFRRTYRIGLMQGAQYAFIATRPALISMFERFGFVQSGRWLLDPIAGELHILVLQLRDREHLRMVSSPLLVELDAFLGGQSL